jgi:hypothetical protein
LLFFTVVCISYESEIQSNRASLREVQTELLPDRSNGTQLLGVRQHVGPCRVVNQSGTLQANPAMGATMRLHQFPKPSRYVLMGVSG